MREILTRVTSKSRTSGRKNFIQKDEIKMLVRIINNETNKNVEKIYIDTDYVKHQKWMTLPNLRV